MKKDNWLLAGPYVCSLRSVQTMLPNICGVHIRKYFGKVFPLEAHSVLMVSAAMHPASFPSSSLALEL